MSWIAALAPSHTGHIDRAQVPLLPAAGADDWRFSDGEVPDLSWFVQGSIMVPDVRWRLSHAWGLCDPHAWSALFGEASYRHGYLHGPTKLYEDLMERALRAFEVRGPQEARRIARRLREKGPCLMCEMDLRSRIAGGVREDVLREGRDPWALQQFAKGTRRFWRSTVCGRCADHPSPVRCRIHFRDDVLHGGGTDMEAQRRLLERIVTHLPVYAQSFVWGHQGTETDGDRAALINAVGWCSGWRGLIAVVGSISAVPRTRPRGDRGW